MNLLVAALSITVLLLTTYSADAFAQFQQGGVDKEGTWYVGEGLEQGDYFHYTICHINYKVCRDFEFEFWIAGDIAVGTETQLLAEVLVRDGNKVIVGNMTMGKLIPEPNGSSPELNDYRRAFGSSVPWLSAYATADIDNSDKGPKAFSDISWGKIANIGGEQILPTAIEDVTVPAGTWETVQITWKTGGYVSKVWVVDDFPFPIKAATLAHVSEGIPPPEYEFVLRDYEQGVQESPFEGIVSTEDDLLPSWCDTDVGRTAVVKKATVNHHYQIHASYGPEDPAEGCEMEWLIKFIKKEDDTEILSQVQFDFLVLDDSQNIIRSIALDEGERILYAPSGQYTLDMIVKEDPGTVNYAVLMYGQELDWVVPEGPRDYLIIPITVFPGDGVESAIAGDLGTQSEANPNVILDLGTIDEIIAGGGSSGGGSSGGGSSGGGSSGGGGCLIATATYGSELAPQVQLLREIRDGTVLSTASGASFMTGFNQIYYLFSPAIADAERENPIFRDAVKLFITPMLSTLSIMTLADVGSEAEVLGLGMSVIALNLGMYVAAPALAGFTIHRRIRSRA